MSQIWPSRLVSACSFSTLQYICMHVWSSQTTEYNQPGELANPVHGQLNRKKIPCSRSRLRIWFREPDLAVPSRVSLLILHTQTESGAYSRDCSRYPWRHPYIFPTPTIVIKYVQIQNISTTTAVLYGHVFPLRLMPVQETTKKLASTSINPFGT